MEKTKKPAPADEYRGVDVNKGEEGKATKKLEKEDTRELNNNPRNEDM